MAIERTGNYCEACSGELQLVHRYHFRAAWWITFYLEQDYIACCPQCGEAFHMTPHRALRWVRPSDRRAIVVGPERNRRTAVILAIAFCVCLLILYGLDRVD